MESDLVVSMFEDLTSTIMSSKQRCLYEVKLEFSGFFYDCSFMSYNFKPLIEK